MGFENVCKSLNAYFSNNKYTASLQPFAMIATLICGGLLVLSSFPSVTLGWFIAIIRVAFWFFFIMLLGTENFLMITVALGLRFAESLIDEIVAIFKHYSYFSSYASPLVYIIVFGFLAYLAYMKSVKSNGGLNQ